MRKLFLFIQISSLPFFAFSQTADSIAVSKIYAEALTNGKSYNQLEFLCKKIGNRLSGSPQAAAAVEWARQELDKVADTVYLQEVMVPHWVRGKSELVNLISPSTVGSVRLTALALGNSVGTPEGGLSGEVIVVDSLTDLAKLGKAKVQGKIVYFNRRMNEKYVNTFNAYGDAVDQRVYGPSEAVKYGAKAVLVRSMTLSFDDNAHTGTLYYDEKLPKIPAAAISTKAAYLLEETLKKDPSLKIFMQLDCQILPEEKSYNVIGEIRGSSLPQEIIVAGGHLDSWDVGEGAHDDGTGCVQAMEVLRIIKALNLKPKRTIRAVMFMNEENGSKGGLAFANFHPLGKEKNIAGIESDAGGHTPKGFSIDGTTEQIKFIFNFKKLFTPFDVQEFKEGFSGSDIEPLKEQGAILIGYLPDSQRYFDYHHTRIDVFENVNKRELELGAATIAAMAYLISENAVSK